MKSIEQFLAAGQESPGRESKGSRASIRAFAEQLVAAGAVLVLPGPPVARYLIGHIAWHGEHSLFWFRAGGMDPDDAHRLKYQRLQRIANLGVGLFLRDQIVAFVSTIPHAGVTDPKDYEIGSLMWKAMVAARRGAICRCCADRFGDERGERRCAWKVCAPHERGFA